MREAIIHLRDRDLGAIGLDGAMTVLRAAGLEDVTELSAEGVLQVHVAEPIPDAALAELEPLEWWENVDESPPGATYLWKLRVPECDAHCPLDEHTTAYEIAAVRDGGVDLSIIGSHDAITESIERLTEAGMRVDLERFAEYRGSATTMDHLTARQQEVMRTAFTLGYYDVPRQTSTEAVAEELGLDPSTVSEHLQRAEHNLVGDVLVPAE